MFHVGARWTICCLVLAVTLSFGCSSRPTLNGALPVHAVEGTLTYKGTPMVGAIITFYPMNPKGKYDPAPSARADGEGRFKLTTYHTGDGAPAGDYTVTIYWPGKPRGIPNEEGDLPPDQLREVYANKARPRLRATVEAKANAINFALPQP